MIVQEPVQAAIWHCLNHYSYKDAIFLAERLYAEVKSDDALFLLATSYYRAGKPGRALSILEVHGCRTAQSKFLMARCCLDLNKLKESEAAVTGGNVIRCKTHEDMINEFGDTACFALQLLGHICDRTERHEEAAEAFKRSLGLNPFLWSSFEAVCNLGEKPDPYKIFQISSLENFNMCQGTNALIQLVNQSTAAVQDGSFDVPETNFSTSTPALTGIIPSHHTFQVAAARNVIDSSSETSQDSCGPPSQPQQLHQQSSVSLLNRFTRLRCHGIRTLLSSSSTNSPVSPCFGMFPLENTISMDSSPNCLALITSPAPTLIDMQSTDTKSKTPTTRLSHVLSPPKPHVFSQSSNMNANMGTSPATMGIQVANDSNVRRSTRLFSSCNSVKENNKSPPSKVRFASSKVSPRRPKTRTTKATISQPTITENTEHNKAENVQLEKPPTFASITQQALYWQKSAAEGLMLLMQEMGMAYMHLAHYNCQKAIEVFSSLPSQHYNTGWVLSNIGRAYYELCNYKKAAVMFSEARLCERHHMEGAEYYSTALWHLQREVSLSALAQELSDYEMNSPETWCVTGNCFSLQKEHDAAIKFFHRAIQVDPNFAYAYTLLGHEYVQTEEMDKAMACFRNAIRIDSRHYNAWYGIGMIYYKQEKFLLAEFHYKKALSINHQSSVLMCHIAVVQHSLQKTDAALSTLNRAIATDPKNPLCKFHRASIFFAIDRHPDALNELEELKEIVPEESLVYFLMGKVHKKLGNTHLALMNFSWAMDLDPKGANNQIKEAIDKRYANDDDGVLANAETGPSVLNATLDEGNCGEAEALDHESSNCGSEDMQLTLMESDESL